MSYEKFKNKKADGTTVILDKEDLKTKILLEIKRVISW